MKNKEIDIKDYTPIRKEIPDWEDERTLYDVYRIPINELYYNENNGRIATWISEYKSDKNSTPLEELSRDKFNELIETFVQKANNKESFKRTKGDILKKGQIKPGVILTDGRVVSGNRRFTILRQLYRETQSEKFANFDCFVLPVPKNENDNRYIKKIERKTQFAVDEKVDYDAVERLVDIYDTIEIQQLWSKSDYAKTFNLSLKDVDKMLSKAKIMIDFLNYKGMPNGYHYARKVKIDGTSQELVSIYDSVDKSEWNRIRPIFYNCIDENKGDKTRKIRELVKMYKHNIDQFNQTLNDVVSADMSQDLNKVFGNRENSIDGNAIVSNIVSESIALNKKESARKKNIRILSETLSKIGTVDKDLLQYLSEEEKNEIKEILGSLEMQIKEIKERL